MTFCRHTSALLAIALTASTACAGFSFKAAEIRGLGKQRQKNLIEASEWKELSGKDKRQILAPGQDLDLKPPAGAAVVAVENEETGEVYFPELEPDGVADLGRRLGTPALANQAAALAEANTRIVDALKVGERDPSSREDLAAAVATADSGIGSISRELALKRWRLAELEANTGPVDPSTTASLEQLRSRIEGIGSYRQLMLLRTAAADEKHYDDARVLHASVLKNLQTVLRSVVLLRHPKIGFLGSGVLYDGRVITAAHVIDTDPLWSGSKPRFDAVTVHFIGDDGSSFDLEHGIHAKTDGSRVLNRLDVAFLALDEPGPGPDAILLERARAASLNMQIDSTGDRLQKGIISGLGAQGSNEAAYPVWMPPARILFPERARVPMAFNDFVGDNSFWRAVRAEALARCGVSPGVSGLQRRPLSVSLPDQWNCDPSAEYDRATSLLVARYSECVDNDQCFLRCPVGDDNRLASRLGDQDMAKNPGTRCFGSELVSHPGLSGAPLFLLGDGAPVLVGVHLGREGSGDQSATAVPASSSNYARSAPIHVALARLGTP